MGKFKVGDKVELLNGGEAYPLYGFINGKVYEAFEEVKKNYKGDTRKRITITDGMTKGFALPQDLQLIESKPTKKQRIKALEERVEMVDGIIRDVRSDNYHEIEAMKKEIAELRKVMESYFKVPVEPSTVEVEDEPKAKFGIKNLRVVTPNQLRAEIIEKAKWFVEKHLTPNVSIASWKNRGCIKGFVNRSKSVCGIPYLTINEQERTVTFVAKGPETGKLLIKTVAKCNPSDVFNEHIGKAIALGRALGLDVSEFEGAVQPSEVVEGHEINITDNEHKISYDNIVKAIKSEIIEYHDGFDSKETVEKLGTIINDTNAIYGEVE